MKTKTDGTIDGRTVDNRARHLVASGHMRPRLTPDARALKIGTALSPDTLKALDRARGTDTRSAYIRRVLEDHLHLGAA